MLASCCVIYSPCHRDVTEEARKNTLNNELKMKTYRQKDRIGDEKPTKKQKMLYHVTTFL